MSEFFDRYNFKLDTFNRLAFGDDYYNIKSWIPYDMFTIKISEHGYVTDLVNLKNDTDLYYKLFNHVYDAKNKVIVLHIADFSIRDDLIFINDIPAPLFDRYSQTQEGEYVYFSIPKTVTIQDEIHVFRRITNDVSYSVVTDGDQVPVDDKFKLAIDINGDIYDHSTMSNVYTKTMVFTFNQKHVKLLKGENTFNIGIMNNFKYIFGYGGIIIKNGKIDAFSDDTVQNIDMINKYILINKEYDAIYVPYYEKPNDSYETYYDKFLKTYATQIQSRLISNPTSLIKSDISEFMMFLYNEYSEAGCKESVLYDDLKAVYKKDIGLFEKMLISQYSNIFEYTGTNIKVIDSHEAVNKGKKFKYPKIQISMVYVPDIPKKYQLFIDNRFYHGKPIEICDADTISFLIGVETLVDLDKPYQRLHSRYGYQPPNVDPVSGSRYWTFEEGHDTAMINHIDVVRSIIQAKMRISLVAKDINYKVFHSGFNLKNTLGVVQIPDRNIFGSNFQVYLDGFLLDADRYHFSIVNGVESLVINGDIKKGTNHITIAYHENNIVTHVTKVTLPVGTKTFENILSAIGDELYINGIYIGKSDLYTPSAVHNVLGLIPGSYDSLVVTILSYIDKSDMTSYVATDYRYQLINSLGLTSSFDSSFGTRIYSETTPNKFSPTNLGIIEQYNKYGNDNVVEGFSSIDTVSDSVENLYTLKHLPKFPVVTITVKTILADYIDSEEAVYNITLNPTTIPKPSFKFRKVGNEYRLYFKRATKTKLHDIDRIKYTLNYTNGTSSSVYLLTSEYIVLNSTIDTVSFFGVNLTTGKVSPNSLFNNPLSESWGVDIGEELTPPSIGTTVQDIVANPYEVLSLSSWNPDSIIKYKVKGPNNEMVEFKSYCGEDIFLSQHFRHRLPNDYTKSIEYINNFNPDDVGIKLRTPMGVSGVLDCNSKNKKIY